MDKELMIEKTLKVLSLLPDDKVSDVFDYVDLLFKKHEEEVLQKGINKLISTSNTYAFLHDEEDLYTVADLKEKY